MPVKVVESTLPPGPAGRRRCLAALPGGMQAWGNGLIGNRGRVEGGEKLSGRPETCHNAQARGYAARLRYFLADLGNPKRSVLEVRMSRTWRHRDKFADHVPGWHGPCVS